MSYLLFVIITALLIFAFILLFKMVLKPFLSSFDSRTAILVLFFGLLFVSFFLSFFSKQNISQAENRNLVKWKPLKEISIINIPKQIDSFVNDHFGFRDFYIRIYQAVQIKIFSQSPIESIIRGKECFLFSKQVINSTYLREPASKKEINSSKIIEKISLLQKCLLKRDIKLFIVICPSKPYVYPEYMPNWIKIKDDNRQTIDNFKDLIRSNTNIPLLDLYPYLLEAKTKEADLLYYKNDTHWNSNGAFYAMLSIEQFLKSNGIRTKDISLKHYGKDYLQHVGDLSRMLNIKSPENRLEYIFEERYPVNSISLSDKSREVLGMNDKFSEWQKTTVKFSKNKNDSIIVPVIIADSYLLASRFSCTELFNKYYTSHYAEMAESLPFLIEKQDDIDIVILSFVDREYNAFVKSIMRWDPDKQFDFESCGWNKKLPH